MVDSTPKQDRKSRVTRRHLTWSLVAVAVVVALVAAGLAVGGSPDRDDPPLSAAPGPGRALPGEEGELEAADATEVDESSKPESTVDSEPNVMQLERAGSSKFDVRDLESDVEKQERPEHEMPYGAEKQCEEAAQPEECEEEEAEEAEQAAEAEELAEEEPAQAGGRPERAAPAPAADASFEGLDFATWGAGHPPDTNGDVGPNHYIQTINTAVGIYDKATGNQLAAFTFDALMSQGTFGNLCDTENFGDPVVLYDSFEDRWILTDFAFALVGGDVSPQHVYECFAVSKTGDPVTGGWNFYSLETPGGLGDYPKLGVWDDGIYMSANMFGYAASSSFQGTHVWALNKAQMYAGAPTAQVVDFAGPTDDFTLIPANARLQAGSPALGTPEYFVSTWNFTNAVNVYKLDVDWTRPSAATFSGPELSFNATSWPNANVANATTPGNNLDVLPIRAMAQAQYSNISGAESLWVTHTVRRADTSGFAAPRWYQLNVSGGTVAASTLQGTTYDPDAANVSHRYIPSLAVDRLGDLAMDYTSSNTTTNPKIVYAGRLAGDPANTFSQGEQVLIAGAGTQSGSCGGTCIRWGDYSGMALDPDGCRFWMTGEYYAVTGLNHQTRIGSFKYPGCAAVGNGTLSGTVTAGGSPASGATVRLGSRTATTNASGAYSFSVPAGIYPSVTASKDGFATGSATSISVPSGGTATQDFALTAPANPGCFTDNSQNAFQTGDPAGCDLTSSPGSVKLATDAAVDQSNLNVSNSGFGVNSTAWAGQTFVPSKSGKLTQVALDLFCSACSGTTPNLTVALRATTGSPALPTGADLATGTITGFSSGAGSYYTATFASPPIVTAGTAYAVVIRATANPSAGTYAYVVSTANPYAAGQRVISANSGGTWTADTTSGGRDLGFKVTIDAGFPASGTFTSSVKDANPAAGSTPDWSTISFTATTPAGTGVTFQVAGSSSSAGPFNYVGPDGTAATFFTSTGASLDQFDGKRYLRYKALLSTSDNTVTPSLSAVSLCFANVATTSLVVAPASGPPEGTAALSATLTATGVPVSGKTVAFSLNGNSVGSATTDAAGVATIANASLAGIAAGTYPNGVSASFAGDATNLVSNGTAALTVSGLPAVTPTPGSWDFGNQRVDTTSTGKDFTITNSGDGPLTVSAVSLAGSNPGDFDISSETCTSASPIAPAGTCQVTVAFEPTATGARTAAIQVSSNAPSSPTSISLTGNGTQPSLSSPTGSVVFEPQRVGTQSTSKTLTLSNIGDAPLSITSAAVTGADASQYQIANNGCSGTVVAPTGSCAIALVFKPSGTGAHNAASLVVSSNDPASPAAIALQGSGVAPKLSVKPVKGKFGTVNVNGGSKTKKFKITNAGTADLKVSKIKLKGAKGNYRMKTKSCTKKAIATGASCTFKVVFDPTSTGRLSAKITIASDGGNATLTLLGIGG